MKKIISILLTLTLCLSLTSFAWADGTEIVVGQDKTLAEAVNEANSGDTIKLPAGEYSLETITGAAGKNLTFIGAGKEATILTYGKVAGTGSDGGGGACYVFDGAGAITFKDVTLQDNVATKDYFRGFVRAASMTFEGCKFTNVAGYWGSGAVKFTNCEFVTEVADSFNMKCYSGTSFEFDGCTFKSPYGFIDAYRQQMLDGSVEIRVKNCEFIGTGDSLASKPAVRLCDYTNAAEGGAWGAYFTGTNVVTNVQEDAVTGTNLYGCRFYDSNTPLLGTVYVEGNKVWESGAKVEIVAKIGNTTYPSLAEAVAAANDGDTVVLLKSGSGDGIMIPEGKFADKGLTIDFNKNSYIVGGVLVGSSGTASNAFQLRKGNKITFMNGAIYGDDAVAGDDTTVWSGAPAIMIQNYSSLTLKNMTIVGGKETCYTLSNNCGDTVIEDSTITAGQGTTYQPMAFDVCRYASYPSVSVTVRGNSVINGNVEVSGEIGEGQSRQLTIENGTFNGKFVVSKEPANIAISGGTFSTDPSAYVTGDFTATKGPNGMWTVAQTVTPDPTPDDPQPERPAHTNRRYPANNTTTTTTDTKKDNVTSARTFDAGIAMYVGMSLLSVAGSAVVIGKKKEF